MTDARLKYTPDRHLRVGDRVVMQMGKEARQWGRGGPADGTEGTIIGKYRARRYRNRFGHVLRGVKPGIYEEDGVAIVHWDGHDPDPTVKDGYSRHFDGVPLKDVPEFKGTADELKKRMNASRTSAHDMALIDQAEVERRYQEDWVDPVHKMKTVSMRKQEEKLLNIKRIGDLPYSMAWEGDVITPKSEDLVRCAEDMDRPVHIRVQTISYEWVSHEPYTYMVGWYYDDTGESAGMGSVYIGDKDIEAVERGNVWKHYHGEPKVFKSLDEEVGFAHSMGLSEEVRNPNNGIYRWTLEEALDAIENNLGHGFTHGSILGTNPRISLYRFDNEDLAQRLREEVLKGFGRNQGAALNP